MAEENSNSFSLVSLGKPIEKLIDTVSKAVGTLYKPRAIRNEADAQAYKIEVLENAKAKASIIKYETENEIAERAKQRLYYLEMQRQLNLDNIVENSTMFLNKSVSDEPVDEDWRTRFFSKAQDITSSELQMLWAKILANEINKPGVVSLRTLDLLSNLSKDEAAKFSKLCGLCTQTGEIIKVGSDDLEKYGISLGDLMILRQAGLVDYSNDLAIVYTATDITTDQPRKAVSLTFQSRGLMFYKEGITKFSFDVYPLTISGIELLRTISVQKSDEYFEDLRQFLIKSGYTVHETRLFVTLKTKPTPSD